ncbi:unnamed protein product, partial [marine sediment metagenome]
MLNQGKRLDNNENTTRHTNVNKYRNFSFVVIILIALFLWGWGLLNIFLGFQSTGLGFISLGFAVLALFLVFEARTIADESDKKMEIISNSSFLEIVSHLQDNTKLNLNNLSNIQIRTSLLLQWRHGLVRLTKLKKWASPSERDNAAFPFITLMESYPWNRNIVKNFEINWIIPIYKNIRKLDPSQEHLNKLMELFKDNVAYSVDEMDFNEMIDRVQNVIRVFNPQDDFQ